jgi:hypothetical protein
MNHEQKLRPFNSWFAALPVVPANKGPARGTIAGALVVLERLKANFDLRLGAHLAPKGAQVKGTSGAVVKTILASLGRTSSLPQRRRTNESWAAGRHQPAFECIATSRPFRPCGG